MHEALRYLPYLLIGTANPYKNTDTPIHIGVPAMKKKKKRNKIVATNQIAYYGELGFRHTF